MSLQPLLSSLPSLPTMPGMDQLLSFGGDVATDAIVHTLKNKLGGAVHALLGAVAFDVLTGPESMDESFSANYAEHALIEGKPRLQWVGDNLNEVTWQLMFHAGFCTPTIELFKLRAAVAAHLPLPLVLMSGAHQGWFVPVSVDVTTRMTRHDGTVLWLEARLTLRESPPPVPMPDATPSQEPVAVAQSTGDMTGTSDSIAPPVGDVASTIGGQVSSALGGAASALSGAVSGLQGQASSMLGGVVQSAIGQAGALLPSSLPSAAVIAMPDLRTAAQAVLRSAL